MQKYEYRQSIRFSLVGDDLADFKVTTSNRKSEDIYNDFLEKYKLLIDTFDKLVCQRDADGQCGYINKNIEVNYKWIRKYNNDNLQEEKDVKNYTIKDFDGLEKIYLNWLERNDLLYEEFENALNRDENEKVKRADVNLLLYTFLSNDYLSFIVDFVDYAKDKRSSINIEKLRQVVKDIQKLSETIQNLIAPSQSSGLEVARGSFNYYTINKISKNFDKDIEQEKKRFHNNLLEQRDVTFLKQVGFEGFLNDNVDTYGSANITDVDLDKLYNALKDFKANQKKEFLEAIQNGDWQGVRIQKESAEESKEKSNASNVDLDKLKGKRFSSLDALAQHANIQKKKLVQNSYHDIDKDVKLFKEYIQKHFPLFDAKDDVLRSFLERTEEIKQLAEQKNTSSNQNTKAIDKKIRDLKHKRGEAFRNYRDGFSEYVKYCNIYKKVAIKRGQIKAKIRSLKQEKIEARLLKYWVHILEIDNKKSLLLIPKDGDNLTKAKQFIAKIDNADGNSELITFHSLTVSALDKLMRRNGGRDLPEYNKGDQEKINFYKQILRGQYRNISLDVSDFDLAEVLDTEFESVEEFRKSLEKVTYVIKRKAVSQQILEKMKKEFNISIFDITAYDFERNIQNKEKTFTDVWNKFWSSENLSDFSLKLNPEVRVFYREAQDDLPKEKQNNRFSKEHLTVAFTVTHNATKEQMNLSFNSPQEIVQEIKKFNEKVIDSFVSDVDDLYYYGIDRGNQELASLGVAKWSKEQYSVAMRDGSVKQLQKPIFPEITTYKIKDKTTVKEITIDAKGNKTTINILQNPSYFVDEIDKYFEKQNAPFIDLTTAKVIKNHIILDGDVRTYINLKKANGKRKMFDVFGRIDKEANVEYCDENHPAWDNNLTLRNAFVIKAVPTERFAYYLLCYFMPAQEESFGTEQKDDLQQEFQEYLEVLRNDPTAQEVTIDNINNLRDAITSNMVGIIAFLFDKYPGIINLENLHSKDDIERLFSDNNENIARRLEWALYRKFQKKGLVPPQLKQTIFLRENENLNQFGIIHFILADGTSTHCPYCAQKANKKRKDYLKLKFTEHALLCEECGFSTKKPKEPLEKIKNSDDVASYNIAKSTIQTNIPMKSPQNSRRKRKR